VNSWENKKRRVTREIKPVSNGRYWNEFDDEDNEEPYTILIRPSSSHSYDDPTEQSLTAYMLSPIMKAFSFIRNSFGKKDRKTHEQSPLLGRFHGADTDSDCEHDFDVASVSNYHNYDTFEATAGRGTAYDAGHMGLLAVSFLMLMVSGALAIGESLSGHKRKHKHIGKLLVVDLSVFVGVLVCLIAGMLGLTLFLMGTARVSWLHRLTVWAIFATACIGCGIILTMTSRDIVGEA
jgi:hypothetical protein